MEAWFRDLRHGVRALLRSRGFTAVAVLTLALGIGANSAIFSVVSAVILQPLPYPEAESLVLIWATQEDQQDERDRVAPAEYFQWREQADLYQDMAAFMFWNFTLTGDGEPESLMASAITPDLLPTLRVEPVLGRNFTSEEAVLGRGDVVLLSHALWRQRFGGSEEVLGTRLTLDGAPHTVVGVMPPDLDFPHEDVQLWTPMAFNPQGAGFRRPSVMVLGRLEVGVSVDQAQAEMTAVTRALDDRFPGRRAEVTTLLEQRVGRIQPVLQSLVAAVLAVLLIACVNVANLVLARAVSKDREMAVREALGASRWALLRRWLSENLVLALAGGVAGLVVAAWGVRLLAGVSPVEIPRLEQAGLDLGVLGLTLVVALGAGLVFTLLPVLQRTGNSAGRLRQGSGQAGGPGRTKVNQGLIVLEVGLALFLLIATGLILRSMVRLQDVPPGFSPDNVLVAQVILPQNQYTGYRASLFYEQVLDGLSGRSGVEAAAAVSALPMNPTPTDFEVPFEIVGQPISAGATPPHGRLRIATEGYFELLDIPLIRGRTLEENDRSGQPRVAVINQTLARRFFADASPLGEKLSLDFQGRRSVEIVGVVGDVRHEGAATPPAPEIFVPFAQVPILSMVIAVRTAADPLSLTEALQREVWGQDPDQPIAKITTMEQLIADSLARERFHLRLLGAFALTALVLAAVGIHGVMSHSVQLRTREIGLRMALGARVEEVLRLILGRVALLTLLGLGLGLVLAVAMVVLFGSRISGMLYQVSPLDPVTYGAAALLLGVVALAAGYLPARRATQVEPMIALECD